MKRSLLFRGFTAALLAGIIALDAGCYGPFQLTKKIYKWNGSVGDKWVNSAVFWVLNIIPVYSVCAFIDAVVLNTIEFYTGKNPLAFSSEKDTVKIVKSQNKTYEVVMGNNRIKITEIKGPDAAKTVTLAYDKQAFAWNLTGAGTTTVVAAFNPSHERSLSLFAANGLVTERQLQ